MSLVFPLLTLVVLGDLSAQQRSMLQAVADKYRQNCSSISSAVFKFTLTEGLASSLDDVRDGQFRDSATLQGFYAFDGDRARYERVIELNDGQPGVSKIGDNMYRQSALSFRVLTDGTKTLRDIIGVSPTGKYQHVVQVEPGTVRFYEFLIFPLNLGVKEPVRQDLAGQVSGALASKNDWRVISFETSATHGSTDVVKIVLESVRGQRTYLVDLKRGAIPIMVEDIKASNGSVTITSNENISLFDNCWLPFRQLSFVRNSKSYKLEINDAKVGPPGRSDFRLGFSKRTAVWDPANKGGYRSKTEWGLEDLPGPRAPNFIAASNSVSKPQPKAPTMPGEITYSTRWLWTLGVGAGVSVVFVMVYVWWRRHAQNGI